MIQYMHLLLVEDELALAEQIITMLRRSNYAVTHVTTGQAAMLTARSGDIDAIILDLGLPAVDFYRPFLLDESSIPAFVTADYRLDEKCQVLN